MPINTTQSQESLQSRLFEKVLSLFSTKAEAIDNLSNLLQVGKSSLYRKINDQSALKPNEIALIIRQYNLSLDQLIHKKSNLYLFNHAEATVDFRPKTNPTFFQNIIQQVDKNQQVLIYYAGFEISPFYLLYFPELIFFKECIWERNQNESKSLDYAPFDFDAITQDHLDGYQSTIDFFEKTSTIELWDKTGLTTIIDQIHHYYHIGVLLEDDAVMLIDKLQQLLTLLEKMLKIGSKKQEATEANMQVYFNPIPSPSWFYIVDTDTTKYVQGVFDSPNSLISFNPTIFENAKKRFESQRQQSHLISIAGTIQRKKLFAFYRKQLEKLALEIE